MQPATQLSSRTGAKHIQSLKWKRLPNPSYHSRFGMAWPERPTETPKPTLGEQLKKGVMFAWRTVQLLLVGTIIGGGYLGYQYYEEQQEQKAARACVAKNHIQLPKPIPTLDWFANHKRNAWEWTIDKAEQGVISTLGSDWIPLGGRAVDKLDKDAKKALYEVASELKMDPNDLATVIDFETAGTFSPTAENPQSKAVGAIQFTISNAKRYAGSVEKLKKMSLAQQIRGPVKRYFQAMMDAHNAGKPLDTLAKVYLAVLYPAYVNRDLDDILFQCGASDTGKAYKQNSIFDDNWGGSVDVDEVVERIYHHARVHGYR